MLLLRQLKWLVAPGFTPAPVLPVMAFTMIFIVQHQMFGERQQAQLYAGGKAARIGYVLRFAGGTAVQLRQAVDEVVFGRGYAVVHGEVDDSQFLGHVVAFEELLRVTMCRTEKEYVDFFQRELVGKYQVCFAVQSFVYVGNFVAGVA